MRPLIGILVGVLFLGVFGFDDAEAVNIRVREVRRDRLKEGLSVVYELRNASVDRWDLRRIELHLFDDTGRRLDLLHPGTPLRRMEREDVEFIRALIPSTRLREAERLEIRIFVEEVKRFPVADPVPQRLVYSFLLRPGTTPAVLRTRTATLRAEPAGTVLSSGSHRAILLRLINRGPETIADLVLVGEISTTDGTRQPFQTPVTPKAFRPGAEAYISLPVHISIVNRINGISLQAFYRNTAGPQAAIYVEELTISGTNSRSRSGGTFKRLQSINYEGGEGMTLDLVNAD